MRTLNDLVLGHNGKYLSMIFAILVLSLSVATAQNIQVNGGVTLGGQIGTSSQPALPFTITTASEPAGIVNSAYTGATIQTQNGVAPITFSQSGTMPPGLSFNTSTGVYSGTPTTAGNYAVIVTATDSTSPTPKTANANYTIAITCTPLQILSGTTLPGATQGVAYSGFQMQSQGGVGSLTWSNPSGAFPTGMSINSGGLISGTPTGTGTSTPTVKVTDSCPTPQSISQQESITVAANSGPLTLTNTTPLPSCTVGQACTIPLTATGGTAPYTFTAPGGWLPSGLSISGATITGTPSAAGTSSGTLTVTDAVPNSNSGASPYSLTVNAASSADNRYCSANETINSAALPQDGPAAPLQTCVRTAMADTPSPGSTVTVVAGSISDLQSKITNAVCGTTIVIPALTSSGVQAVYNGQIQPKATCTGSQWITVETDQMSHMPAEGNRATPAWIGIASLPGRPAYAQPSGGAAIYMPKLINNNSVILAQAGMSHWRFIGLELTTTSGATVQPAIFLCSTNCDHVIADRMLIHGGNSPTGQDRDSVQVGFRSDGTYNAVIDSYIFDIHCVANGVCVDNYAIFPGGVSAGANNTFKAVDNFLEAAGEGIITGGGGQGAGNTTTTLTDLEVRRNHLFKPLFWKSNDPSYFGTNFIVKNCFELKNTSRVLFEGNLCDTNWGGQSDQFGTLINLGSKNQANAAFGSANTDASGNVTWVSGTQFNSSLVSPLCATPNHCNIKINGSSYQVQTYISPTQITVSPATTAQTSVSYTEFFPGLNPNAIVSNITIRYSQLSHASRCLAMFTVPSDGGDIALGTNSITIHDIVCDDISTIWNVSTGACCFWASSFQVQNGYASPDNMHDILIHHVTALSFQNFGTYANGNGGPSFGFGFQSSPTGAVPHLQIYDNIGTVGWTGSASICNTGQDSVLNRMKCYDTLNGVAQGTYCFDHNLFATSTQGTISGATNNTPYPAATDSPGCGFTRTGQQFVTSFANIGFTNLNGANGGNYQLLNTSPGHNAASDGTDLGVNWSALQTNIAGVN